MTYYILFFILAVQVSLGKTDCRIEIKTMHLQSPLLLKPKTKEIVFPEDGKTFVNLKENEKIEMDCTGSGKITAGGVEFTGIAEATCDSKGNLEIAKKAVDIRDVHCSSEITTIAKLTGKKCWGVIEEIEVGFQLQDNRFLPQYTTCFDANLKNVLYSKYSLTKNIANRFPGTKDSPRWSEDNFYKLSEELDQLYREEEQRKTLNRQVGLAETSEKYVKKSGGYYLARGHLTARADYMYNAQQLSTYHYINSVPQWQTFNGENWCTLEDKLRQYAKTKKVDLEVYTGTYGITTLPHELSHSDVKLYFYDQNGKKAMPIPELFWKVIYDKRNQAGIVFLGINNPYQTDTAKSVHCTNVAEELTWWKLKKWSAVKGGYMYACKIDDFRKLFPNLPAFETKKVLN